MDGTMMDFPLTLTPILERAGKLFPDVEIVTRLPDKSLPDILTENSIVEPVYWRRRRRTPRSVLRSTGAAGRRCYNFRPDPQ